MFSSRAIHPLLQEAHTTPTVMVNGVLSHSAWTGSFPCRSEDFRCETGWASATSRLAHAGQRCSWVVGEPPQKMHERVTATELGDETLRFEGSETWVERSAKVSSEVVHDIRRGRLPN